MNTHKFLSTVARLAVGAVCMIGSAGCGSEMLRTGRSPVYLVITNISPGGALHSDVEPPSNDVATVQISSESKNQNPTVITTPLNDVTLTRYRVTYRRTDGRNTPGVDVPYGFDGGLSVFVPVGGSGSATFDIVRRQAKEEPPLANLTSGGGLVVISTIAEVTFYGHDQNGNEVSVTGRVDIQFADN